MAHQILQPELLAVLLCDQIIDDLDSVVLKVQFKQAIPANLLEAWISTL